MNKGFTLLELLIATAISALFAAAVAATVPSLQAFFEHAPATIDMQQRGRTAIDAIAQAVRAADHVLLFEPDPLGGHFTQLMTIAEKANAAQGVLAADQSGPGGDLWLSAARCPGVPDVCGFSPGSSALIAGGDGQFELFTVGSVDAGTRTLSPRQRLDRSYAAGATLVSVDAYTFRLDAEPDGALTLVRQTHSGAVQPMVDRVSHLEFTRAFDDRGIGVAVKLQSHGMRAETARHMAIVTRNRR